MRLEVTVEGASYAPDEQYRVLEVARAADDLGVDFIDTTEHVLMGLGALEARPGLADAAPGAAAARSPGDARGDRGGDLAHRAGVVDRDRPAAAGGLAGQAGGASLYALSRGRFVLGVTTSWHKDEYDALGVPFAERGQVLNDNIGACRALWSGAPAAFHSRFVNFDGMFCSPRPPAGERIPVWFGGKFTERQIRRVVELGDGWMPFGGLRMTVPRRRPRSPSCGQRYVAAGRDPATLEVCDALGSAGGSVERTLEQVPALAEAGVTIVRAHLRHLSKGPDTVIDTLEEIVRRFEPMRSLNV